RGHGAYPLVAAIPAQRVDGEVTGEHCLQPADKRVDRFARIADNRAARGNQDVRLPLPDLAEALDDVARACGPAMVTILLHLGDGVLEAEQIKKLAAAVNQVTHACDALAVDLDEIRHRAPR